jgi:AraC family transcriptional regulator
MSFHVEEDRPMIAMVGVAHRGPYPEIGHACGKLAKKIAEHQLQPTGPMTGIFLDDPHSVAPEALRSFAAIPVAEAVADPELEAVMVTGGRYAVWNYQGSYENLVDQWNQFSEALRSAGIEDDGSRSCFETYTVPCETDGDPSAVTDLYIPIK